MPKVGKTNNLVVVSDLHCGCKTGLCPPEGIVLDGGGRYEPSMFQLKIWSWWDTFWNTWVPMVTRGESFDVLVNGDSTDGNHHGSTTQISHNLGDQANIAYAVLAPVREKVYACNGRFFMVRGTEAHVGPSGVEEERLANRLQSEQNAEGQSSRYELWIRVGTGLVHCLHHIGTTGSANYESTAVHKELVESFTEAARSGEEPPAVIVRSHRHRYIKTSLSTEIGEATAIVTAGWQGKNGFAFKIAGARLSQPQFGGILTRSGDEDPIYTRHFTKHLSRPGVE